MSKTISLQSIDDITFLTDDELTKVKGGILLTCEEKRSKYATYTVWTIKNDGSLWPTIKM